MSRAALWRQEGNAKERERRCEEVFESAVENGRRRSSSKKSSSNVAMPLWGPDDSFHFNPLLLRNTIHSPYFQKCCETLSEWNAVIDEIYYEVKHLEPFSNDKTPSTAFCLLLRLLTLRMTEHQMNLTLNHPDSPYIRGIGFLYLRFAGMPDQVLRWIEPYFHDEEEFVVEAASAKRAKTITMGQFVRDLFASREFYGTPLPRFPLDAERIIKVRLLQAEKVAERAAHHFKNQQRMNYFGTLGNQIMALYGDDHNPLAWYKAVIDRVITRDQDTGLALKYPRYVVTFTEYGNTETITLGEMDVLDGNWRQDKHTNMPTDYERDEDVDQKEGARREAAWRDNNNSRDQDIPRMPNNHHRPATFHDRGRRDDGNRKGSDWYDEIRQRERDTATSHRGWARPPATAKTALTLKRPRGHLQESHEIHHHHKKLPGKDPAPPPSSGEAKPDAGETQKKRSAEEMAAFQEKKQKLLAKYG